MGTANDPSFPNGLSTQVRAVMTTPAVSVRQSDTVRDVINKMVEGQISSLAVVDQAGKVAGMVSASDLLKVVLATDKALDSDYPHYDDCLWAVDLIQQSLGTDKVSEVMSEVITTVCADESIQRAAEIMHRDHIHHLPVVDPSGPLLGMLSSHDFVKLVAALR